MYISTQTAWNQKLIHEKAHLILAPEIFRSWVAIAEIQLDNFTLLCGYRISYLDLFSLAISDF